MKTIRYFSFQLLTERIPIPMILCVFSVWLSRRFLYYSVSSPSTPDQLDQFVNVQSYLFKIKSFRARDLIRNAEKTVFSQFRSDSMSQCNTACSNTACATPPVERRPWNTACSTHQTANKKQKLVSHNFLAASVKKHCFQDTNINKKTFCFYQISITLLYIIL